MLWLSGKADGHRLGEWRAPDGAVIPFREWWRPDARAAVAYLHGQGDHSGPFTAMGDLLHEWGLSVYAHDHRGFGLSQERRGDIASYDLFVADVQEMIHLAQERNPGRPVFLLGLSMGGHIALRAAVKAANRLAGVIAMSPGFKLRNAPPWSMVIKTLLTLLVNPGQYMPPAYGAVQTTRNNVHLARADQDEHWVTVYTARFHLATIRSIRKAKQELRRLHVPTLILQAGNDLLICPDEARRFFNRIVHPDKEFRLLEGLCHNLVAEPEMPEIARTVADWIDRRIGAADEHLAWHGGTAPLEV